MEKVGLGVRGGPLRNQNKDQRQSGRINIKRDLLFCKLIEGKG